MAMGTSIWLIVLIPAMFFVAIFNNAYTAIFGEAKSELVLPYNESEGIVWEYDNVNDYYMELVETRIEGERQIFVFENEDCKEDINGLLMDVVFTDKNGNQIKYYALKGDTYNGPTYYEADECYVAQYTVTAEKERRKHHWETHQENESILCQPEKEEGTDTFTIVMTPDDIGEGTLEEAQLVPRFVYENRKDKKRESIFVYYKVIDGVLTEFDPYA